MGGRISAEMIEPIDHPLKAPVTETVAVAAPPVVRDRRREGRVQQVSPTLIPLLRDPAHYVELDEDTNPLATAQGVMVGSLISVPLWGLIALGCWLFF
jgi:hypothetical protein